MRSKRLRDESLKLIENVPPSSFGCISGHNCWPRLESKVDIKMHRPTPDRFGIHSSLLHLSFGEMAENIKSVQLDRQDYVFTLLFCQEMSQVYPNEGFRQKKANELLTSYFQRPVEVVGVGNSTCATDSAIIASCGQSKRNKILVFICEYKNEIGSSSSMPNEQCVGYYLKHILESEFARNRSVCPILLMSLIGPNMSLWSAVNADGPSMEPMTPLLPLLILPHDKPMMISVSRALKAAKLCISSLIDFYDSLPDTIPTEFEYNQLMFPYVRSFLFQQRVVKFDYDVNGQHGNKLVFNAHIVEGGEGLTTDIIIKFTQTYCAEAHLCCLNFENSAPILYSVTNLPDGWLMIAMEHVKGEQFKPGMETETIYSKLQSIISHLHSNNYVHGDMRGNFSMLYFFL